MKKFDKDGDGKLSEEEKAELRKAIAQRGGRPGGRRPPPELMKKFDKDGDGKLSESERAELRKKAIEVRNKIAAPKSTIQKIKLIMNRITPDNYERNKKELKNYLFGE